MRRSTVILGCASLVAAALGDFTPARAGDPMTGCDISAGLSCAGMQVTVCPAGDFEYIRDGCGIGLQNYIWVIVRTSYGVPIPGVPATDFWLNACDPATQLALCAAPMLADSTTGSNGRTTISGRIAGGGCARAGGIWIAVWGIIVSDPDHCERPLCLDIVIKSLDIMGEGGHPDGIVNLSDLIPFGSSYNKNMGYPGFNPCCDYNDDIHCNLSDFAFFGTHYQHRCP